DAEVVLVRVGDDEEERLGWWDWLGVGHPSSIPYLFPMIKDVIKRKWLGVWSIETFSLNTYISLTFE
ncbi:MAG: hypothetical protein AB7F35_25480, partial [Acetobacteraceae bacterium]|uniref:hypothetical protein n=1 Tax=Bradyrhizobium sp. TaxID=376 RepID=UPI003D0C5440